MIRLLPEQKRHDLMCLMFLGRNLEYYGLCQETVDDFCVYADEKVDGNCSGSTDPEYLAGKVRIARWLRLVKKRIQPDIWYVGTRYDGDVRLREITAEDADFMMRLITDRKVTRFIPGMIQDREMLISWIQSLRPSDHEYIITIEETGEEIGECSLTKQGDSAEIGFMLLPKYWLQGYGTEVVTSLVEIARDMRLNELTATTDARNKAAIRLLEKCGFKKQKHGWMVVIPEGEESKVSGGQNIIQFQRSL
jgi:RimJ/RimL family protein N-acetyltransferase